MDHRCGLDPTLLWLWCWPAAVAPIRPLAWEFPYATGAALKRQKRPKKKKKRKKEKKKWGQENCIIQMQRMKLDSYFFTSHNKINLNGLKV